MTLLYVPMQEHHVRALVPQRAQAHIPVEERVKDALGLAQQGQAWAVVSEAGVVCLAGVQPQWGGRAVAWALLSEQAGRSMVALTRAARRYFDGLDYARVEMYVDAGFAEGCRWARLLGFRNETPDGMVGFLPNGNRAFMYGRVK
jgi:hypothetical protein